MYMSIFKFVLLTCMICILRLLFCCISIFEGLLLLFLHIQTCVSSINVFKGYNNIINKQLDTYISIMIILNSYSHNSRKTVTHVYSRKEKEKREVIVIIVCQTFINHSTNQLFKKIL